jgi:acetyltransferase-like isoleucine patch superfamily enzyme
MIKGNDWLGLKSIVLKGVHIGQGVVAAYTLDNEHVRARSIVAGVPARQVPNR